MARFKGFGKPPEPKYFLAKDVKRKVASGQLKPSITIASDWIQSLTAAQKDFLCKQLELYEVGADIIATVILLASLEQGIPTLEFTEQEVTIWLQNFLTLVSVIRMVDNGFMEVTHFPPIHRDENFGSRLTAEGELLRELIEATGIEQ